jgi:hypothetical protein
MPKNFDIDDNLIVEVLELGGHKSEKDAVNEAPTTYIRLHKQQRILELFGTIDLEKDYDYKVGRKR